MSRKNRRKQAEIDHKHDEEEKPKAFIWHTEKDHRGKIIEKILGDGQSSFAKAHQKWLDDKRKNAARNAFKRSKKDSENN